LYVVRAQKEFAVEDAGLFFASIHFLYEDFMLFLVAANSSFHQDIFAGCDTRVFEGFLHIFASLHRMPFSFAREASMSALVVKVAKELCVDSLDCWHLVSGSCV
jgi:hypothetical protein